MLVVPYPVKDSLRFFAPAVPAPQIQFGYNQNGTRAYRWWPQLRTLGLGPRKGQVGLAETPVRWVCRSSSVGPLERLIPLKESPRIGMCRCPYPLAAMVSAWLAEVVEERKICCRLLFYGFSAFCFLTPGTVIVTFLQRAVATRSLSPSAK